MVTISLAMSACDWQADLFSAKRARRCRLTMSVIANANDI